MTLKANELTDRIEAAFEAEWAKTKSIALSAVGADDRRMLFAAVANGVLAYLKEKDSATFKTIALQPSAGGDSTTYDVTGSELDVAVE